MNIIETKRFRKTGNDCLIEVIVSLVEVFHVYLIFKHTRYIGSWCDDKIRSETYEFGKKEDAIDAYQLTVGGLSSYENLD